VTTDPAVTTAAEALVLHVVALRRSDLTVVCDCGYDCDPYHWGDPWETHLAEAAVAAARPIIEAEVRERIAAEIEARIEPPDETPCVNGPGCPECIDGRALRDAVRIARGTA
jgi:hypothetical protein